MATKPRSKTKEAFGPPVTVGNVTLKSYMDFVVLCENQLGWLPDTDKQPLFKARAIEVAKLKRKIAEKPKLYTWPNLIATLKYCQQKKLTISSPAAVCWKVEKALKDLGPQESALSDVGSRIHLAIAWEHQHDLPDKDDWVTQLTRAGGSIRDEVLVDWKRARFG